MKMIKALIKPLNLNEVKIALQEMGIDEIWTEEILVSKRESNGLKKGGALLYREAELVTDFMAKMKVEIIVADGLVDRVVSIIRKIAITDQKADCRIYILPLIEAL